MAEFVDTFAPFRRGMADMRQNLLLGHETRRQRDADERQNLLTERQHERQTRMDAQQNRIFEMKEQEFRRTGRTADLEEKIKKMGLLHKAGRVVLSAPDPQKALSEIVPYIESTLGLSNLPQNWGPETEAQIRTMLRNAEVFLEQPDIDYTFDKDSGMLIPTQPGVPAQAVEGYEPPAVEPTKPDMGIEKEYRAWHGRAVVDSYRRLFAQDRNILDKIVQFEQEPDEQGKAAILAGIHRMITPGQIEKLERLQEEFFQNETPNEIWSLFRQIKDSERGIVKPQQEDSAFRMNLGELPQEDSAFRMKLGELPQEESALRRAINPVTGEEIWVRN